MGRQRYLVVLAASAAFLLSIGERSFAQGPQQGGPGGPGIRQGNGGRQFRPARERWREMSPEDRQRFRSNADRWAQMPPEQRQELRLREGVRRQRIQREAQAALQGSGLELEAERREAYERRYMQERRRIERELREELQQRRERELAPVVERLKKEFTQPQGLNSPATSGSAASASPGK